MRTITFFNNKGGVGKTSLVYHLAWMLSMRGHRVLVADVDPQSNATSMFLEDEEIEDIWGETGPSTIFRALHPLIRGLGDIETPRVRPVADRLWLIAGDLQLSDFEDQLSESWPKNLGRDERSFRVTSAISRAIQRAARDIEADIALLDVGPNLGAINRAALVASDEVVLPLSPDLFAIQGLRNVGPKLRDWREDWRQRRAVAPSELIDAMPQGEMRPIGYVVSRYNVRKRGPVKAFQRWLDRTPEAYRTSVLDAAEPSPPPVDSDPYCLARLKDYASLMPLAQEARKPMFLLKPADGAIGGHQSAVQQCRADFEKLAVKLEKQQGAGQRVF